MNQDNENLGVEALDQDDEDWGLTEGTSFDEAEDEDEDSQPAEDEAESLFQGEDDWGEEPEKDEAEEQGREQNQEPEAGEEAAQDGETEEKQPETETKDGEEGHQLYTLKVNGQERQVSLDEMTTLAQKGLDYDGLRADRDSLREGKAKGESYGAFLQEMAEAGGVSVEELMEQTRAQILMQKAKAEGRDLSEEEARTQVKAAKAPEEKPKPQAEPSREQKQQEAVQRFLNLYPNVKGEDIPQAVWDEAERVGDLIGPYQRHLAAKLDAREQTLRQNEANRKRSTGSRKTAGAATSAQAFDAAWYDGE